MTLQGCAWAVVFKCWGSILCHSRAFIGPKLESASLRRYANEAVYIVITCYKHLFALDSVEQKLWLNYVIDRTVFNSSINCSLKEVGNNTQALVISTIDC
jgi:hypothetical protein